MTATIMQDIIDFGKEVWADAEMVFEDYIVPLAKQLGTDELALLVKALETDVANMTGGFSLAQLAADGAQLIATFATQGKTIAETDVVAAAAAVLAKISSVQAAAAQVTPTSTPAAS